MLAALAGLAAQGAIGRIRQSVRANPFAPARTAIPDQAAVAVAQSGRGALRAGTSGLAGSEADYYTEGQGAESVGLLRITQELTSARRPAAMFTPGDPGAGREPTVTRDFTRGPVRRFSNAQNGNTRTVNTAHQHVISSTLNPPGARTPTPKEMAAARAAGAPQGAQDALADYWGD